MEIRDYINSHRQYAKVKGYPHPRNLFVADGFFYSNTMRKKKITYYPLVFAKNYFISLGGFIFYKGDHIKLLPFIKNGSITVNIEGADYSVLNLMLEYFFKESELVGKDIKYNSDKKYPLRIPKRMILITGVDSEELDDNDYFNCASRASSANRRSKETITKSDVIRVLREDDYSCQYCGKKVKKKNWHLDHIHPLSKGGKNIVDNLCVSCSTCNLMKNSMIKHDFIHKCGSIYKFNNQNN